MSISQYYVYLCWVSGGIGRAFYIISSFHKISCWSTVSRQQSIKSVQNWPIESMSNSSEPSRNGIHTWPCTTWFQSLQKSCNGKNLNSLEACKKLFYSLHNPVSEKVMGTYFPAFSSKYCLWISPKKSYKHLFQYNIFVNISQDKSKKNLSLYFVNLYISRRIIIFKPQVKIFFIFLSQTFCVIRLNIFSGLSNLSQFSVSLQSSNVKNVC